MNLKSFQLLVCFFFILATLPAQNNSGIYTTLNVFLGSDFFVEYKNIRSRAEEAVINFEREKAIYDYSEEEVNKVMSAYNSSAEYFNLVLKNIQRDMMQKHKRKYMARFPEDYAKQVEMDLARAKEFYEATFKKEVSDLTEGRITGAGFLAQIPVLIKYIKAGISLIKKIDKEIKKMNMKMLDTYLYEPNRFRMWDEIIGGANQ